MESIIYSDIPARYAVAVLPRTIGDNIRELREEQNLRQEDLAARAGLKQGDISKWERGKNQPKAPNLLRLSVGLNRPIDALIKGIDDDYEELFRAQQKRDAPNVATQDRLQKLETLVAEYQSTLSEVRDIAKRLTRIAAFGGKGHAPRRAQRKSG